MWDPSFMLEVGEDILEFIETITRTNCGFAAARGKDVALNSHLFMKAIIIKVKIK